jgi:hypothetical protein
MESSKYRYGSWVLGIIVLYEMVVWRQNPSALVIGLPYLMLATLISSLCALTVAAYRSRQDHALLESSTTFLKMSPPILFWTAAQLMVLGTLNVFDFERDEPGTGLRMTIGYATVVVFFVACYRLLAIAEDPNQTGGYIPLKVFGLSRSRRLLFTAFGGYVNCSLLTIASLEVSLEHGWAPHALLAPAASLLMVTIMSLITMLCIANRYRHTPKHSYTLERFIFISAISFLIGIGFIDVYLDHECYLYVLDCLTVLACSLSTVYLSRLHPSSNS